jgi:hypothetical protein
MPEIPRAFSTGQEGQAKRQILRLARNAFYLVERVLVLRITKVGRRRIEPEERLPIRVRKLRPKGTSDFYCTSRTSKIL